jgi:glycosyltransferase involved in cell wall biosynthesis
MIDSRRGDGGNRRGLTVVTVCLNAAQTIKSTIDSVLAQKNAGVEYVVVDGGSCDGTLEIIASYGDQIDTLISEPDRGIADAFNKGIACAQGSVIGLLNADDVLLPGALSRVLAWFDAHPEREVLHGDVLLYDGEKFIKRMKPAKRWWYPWRLVLFNHPATFVKRELYERMGGFDPAYTLAMDVEIFARWSKLGANIHYAPHPLVRMRTGGVSGRHPQQGYAEARRALVSHGFSPLAANAQYLFRFGVQLVVILQTALRRSK